MGRRMGRKHSSCRIFIALRQRRRKCRRKNVKTPIFPFLKASENVFYSSFSEAAAFAKKVCIRRKENQ